MAPAVVRLGSVSVWKVCDAGGRMGAVRAALASARMLVWSSSATLAWVGPTVCAASVCASRVAVVIWRKLRLERGRDLMRGEGSTGKCLVAH